MGTRHRGKAARAELPPARKMEKMRLWFERNKGIPPRGDTSPGFDMGKFWDGCCSGQCKELFAAALSESPNMKAAHDARLEGKTATARSQKAARKMEKMRRWFEQNEGIPPTRDTSPGFDMGDFWHHCCSGCNKELFATALSESPKMKTAHETRLEGSTPRGHNSPNKRRRTSRA